MSKDSMKNTAIDIVEKYVDQILKESSDESLSWLPRDFGRQIAEIAWDHQCDIDKTVFRRKLKRYLDTICEEGDLP